MIERLLVQCRNQREQERFEIQLLFTDTKELREIYARQEPKLIAEGERYHRILRRQERRKMRVDRLNANAAYFSEWSKRWRMPSEQYPIKAMPPAFFSPDAAMWLHEVTSSESVSA